MDNLARKVREKLGLTQVAFAQKLGRSYQSVKNWEAGMSPSPGARQAIVDLAAQYGLGDVTDDWIADAEGVTRMPAGTVARGADHDRLQRILDSGNAEAIQAVRAMLKAFDRRR